MQCKICGGNYKNLGVHVQKKHMPCDDYRRQFDIPLTAPLADAALCELFSVSALQRLEDPAWLEQCKNASDSDARLNGKLLTETNDGLDRRRNGTLRHRPRAIGFVGKQ